MNPRHKERFFKELVIIGIVGVIIMILIPIILKGLKWYIYLIFEGIVVLTLVALGVIDYFYHKKKS